METLSVEARQLGKRFGDVMAVDAVDLEVHGGEVVGLVGPNGAGKTTTLRLLLGLQRPTSGSATVLGHPPGDPQGLGRLGALLERPGFYPYLSGADNLAVLARYAGVGAERVEETLAAVRLTDRARDKVKTYSMGMRQRLGVAAALLKAPDLLVLDEPTNGLDPVSNTTMQALVRDFVAEGGAVLLSSHALHEVEQLCDRVWVLNAGQVVASGSVDELRGRQVLLVGAEPLDVAAEIVAALPQVDGVEQGEGRLEVTTAVESAADINAALVGAGVRVTWLVPGQRSLEDVFIELTGGGVEW